MRTIKPLLWVGSAKKNLAAMPVQKKSKHGIATSKKDMDLIASRLKTVAAQIKDTET